METAMLDPVTNDPSTVDRDFPAAMAPVTFESQGSQVIGNLLLPQGRGPHPVVLLLHGFPGNENNYDLGHALRRAGWSVLLFHYRGCWGSQGTYSFGHVLRDVQSALTFLRDSDSRTLYRLDTDNTVLVGHSMGGFTALLSSVHDPAIHAVASLAGSNRGLFASAARDDPLAHDRLTTLFDQAQSRLSGTSTDDLTAELLRHGDDWDLIRYAETLASRAVLLVAGSRDTVVPPKAHHTPLVKAMQNAGAQDLTHVILDADHAFSDKRIALARTVVAWLENQKS
jgi:pimeloyl-ACP methyl ester carboxylesterase